MPHFSVFLHADTSPETKCDAQHFETARPAKTKRMKTKRVLVQGWGVAAC
ncbi:hypothetical protein RISK_003364 [Rhodopirellula islandica]|uniref:Uncharacterized protein n=1 Tax=Rhodopirellula islandica TaxID=595434 RepID=A0A0J1BDR9_RHOIS|nr:hypothetical protein RISK_003364 [Rhodopirellula islandica]